MKKRHFSQGEDENTLSDAELNMLKNSIASEKVDRSKLPHYDNSDRARLLRYAKKNRALTAVCAVIAVCVIVVLAFCVVFAVKRASERPNTDDFTIFIGDEEYSAEYKKSMRDGVLYIDFYPVARYAELTLTGSAGSVKFTSDKTNYLRFENDSDMAVINGDLVELGGKATVTREVCEIPLDFLIKTIGGGTNGLRITLDKDTNTIKFNRRIYKTDDKDVIKYVEIMFYSDSFDVLQSIKRPTDSTSYSYPQGVEAFLSSLDPENASEYLILVNKQNPLGENYAPKDLDRLTWNTDINYIYLRRNAANAAYAMMLAMEADGADDVYITSAYRSYEKQVDLFEEEIKKHTDSGKTREEAIALVNERGLLAEPGKSEHQSGLCIDLIEDGKTVLDESFEDTKAFKWLSENAYKYGFILRYPEDKTETTEYKYEPWHYRFVGRTAAAEIHASGLCLEEYLELN